MTGVTAEMAGKRSADAVGSRASRLSRKQMVAAAFFVLALAVPAWAVPWLQLGLVSDAVCFAVAVLGVNLIVGYAGQISLGHGAFVGLGAYTTVVLSGDHGWPLLLTVIVARPGIVPGGI